MSPDDILQGQGGEDPLVIKLTVVALVISIAAFALSSIQALLAYLQFDNSELGRRRCSEEVMGKLWASQTSRKYNWHEFRYQVFFQVPVFYTAPPGITVGPLTLTKPEVTLRTRFNRFFQDFSDAEPESIDTEEPRAVELEVIKLQPHVAPIYKITGTPTSYKNTLTKMPDRRDGKWANVHTAEDEGCSWVLLLDALQGQERLSRAWDRGLDNRGLDHTISYLIQKKTRCWDFMPLNATKPFATTTICHLVEIMAMLGLVWTEFDVKASTLSAEGNGYMIKSEYTAGLGILTRFSRLSKPTHEGNRIIPCKEIKRLCFGEVPSLFDDMSQKLVVGPQQIEACLEALLPELSPEHREPFLPSARRNAKPPLISPTFELIAMVARSVHIPGSRFRRLPNPCADVPPHTLNAAACLRAFATRIKSLPDPARDQHVLTLEIKNSFEHGRFDGNLKLDASEGRTLEQLVDDFAAANSTLENEKAERFFAPAGEREARKRSAENVYNDVLLDLLDALHSAVRGVDQRLKHQELTDEVRNVTTAHFAAVFERADELARHLGQATSKEEALVAFYFDEVQPDVVRVERTASSAASVASTVTAGSAGPMAKADADADADARRRAVWLSLMFKMWAWLFLHSFNPFDRMIERTEFQNSRLPVYIG